MKLIRLPANQHCVTPPLALTIGNFDGIHVAHQEIIKKLKAVAAQRNLATGVIIFEPQPNEFFNPGKTQRIYSLQQKLKKFKQLNVDYVFCIKFDHEFSMLAAEDFVKNILTKLNVKYLIIGDDFRFGYKRSGDFQLLKSLSTSLHFECEQMPSILISNERVSSTNVRKYLQSGDFKSAENLLGHPYQISGHITYGDQRGRKFGYPTANIALKNVRPVHGIYAVLVHGIDAKPLPGAASIGWRPTIGDNKYFLEIYLLDFDRDIYGKKIQVEFIAKIRDEEKFSDIKLLIEQMQQDVQKVTAILTS